MPDYEDPLDDQQRAAVEATEPAIAVLAGPGSGKTRTLSYRARHLLLGDPDARALLLTFTNKAAAEMKFRAIGVAAVASNRIQASTFHTFGMRTLRSHGPLVGIEADFELIDEEEQKELALDALGSDAGIEGWSRARIRRLTRALASPRSGRPTRKPNERRMSWISTNRGRDRAND